MLSRRIHIARDITQHQHTNYDNDKLRLTMIQSNVANVQYSAAVKLSLLCLGGAAAFMTPPSLVTHPQEMRTSSSSASHRAAAAAVAPRERRFVLNMANDEARESTVATSGADEAAEKAAKLRAFAAELRLQVCGIEHDCEGHTRPISQPEGNPALVPGGQLYRSRQDPSRREWS